MSGRRLVGKRAKRRQNVTLLWVIGGVVAAAAIAVALVSVNASASTTAASVATPSPPAPLDACGAATCGQANAPVTIDVYADFQCPYCAQFEPALQQLKAPYIDTGKVRLAYHSFPFIGPESETAAQAADCAADQNQFWRFAHDLFTHQGTENSGVFTAANLKIMAASLGLNTASFNSCLDSNKYAAAVESDYAQGQRLGVQSTPTFFVNGQRHEGGVPYQQLSALIDAALANKAS